MNGAGMERGGGSGAISGCIRFVFCFCRCTCKFMQLFTHSQQQFAEWQTNVASDQIKLFGGVPESRVGRVSECE